MKFGIRVACFFAAVIAVSVAAASGNPLRLRRSGHSDQYLAELETYLGLLPTITVDLDKIGKRKRSLYSENEERSSYPVDFGGRRYGPVLRSSISDFLATVRRKRSIQRDG